VLQAIAVGLILLLVSCPLVIVGGLLAITRRWRQLGVLGAVCGVIALLPVGLVVAAFAAESQAGVLRRAAEPASPWLAVMFAGALALALCDLAALVAAPLLFERRKSAG
jgi:hypothetical protein